MKIKFEFLPSFFVLTHLFSYSFNNEQNAIHHKKFNFFSIRIDGVVKANFVFIFLIFVIFVVVVELISVFFLFNVVCFFIGFRLFVCNIYCVYKLVRLSIFLYFYALFSVLWRLFIRFSLISSYLPHWIYYIYSIYIYTKHI